jgi:tRNA (guanine-N7-)-methyltransferase
LPRLRAHTVGAAYIHFPDPWWKKRHEKRLLLTPAFAGELARVLVPGGELFVQTDVSHRALAYESTLSNHGSFRALPLGSEGESGLYGAKSPRERRAERDGLPVFRLRYATRG